VGRLAEARHESSSPPHREPAEPFLPAGTPLGLTHVQLDEQLGPSPDAACEPPSSAKNGCSNSAYARYPLGNDGEVELRAPAGAISRSGAVQILPGGARPVISPRAASLPVDLGDARARRSVRVVTSGKLRVLDRSPQA